MRTIIAGTSIRLPVLVFVVLQIQVLVQLQLFFVSIPNNAVVVTVAAKTTTSSSSLSISLSLSSFVSKRLNLSHNRLKLTKTINNSSSIIHLLHRGGTGSDSNSDSGNSTSTSTNENVGIGWFRRRRQNQSANKNSTSTRTKNDQEEQQQIEKSNKKLFQIPFFAKKSKDGTCKDNEQNNDKTTEKTIKVVETKNEKQNKRKRRNNKTVETNQDNNKTTLLQKSDDSNKNNDSKISSSSSSSTSSTTSNIKNETSTTTSSNANSSTCTDATTSASTGQRRNLFNFFRSNTVNDKRDSTDEIVVNQNDNTTTTTTTATATKSIITKDDQQDNTTIVVTTEDEINNNKTSTTGTTGSNNDDQQLDGQNTTTTTTTTNEKGEEKNESLNDGEQQSPNIILYGNSKLPSQSSQQRRSQKQQLSLSSSPPPQLLLHPNNLPPGLFIAPQQRQLQQQQQQQMQQSQQNSVIIVELVASIVGTAIRLWFLTWITRLLASQDQIITPIQHFVYERLNDRYDQDKHILLNVINNIPPSHMKYNQWKRFQRKYTMNQRKDLKNNTIPSSSSISHHADTAGTTFDRTVIVIDVRSDSKGNIDVPYFTDIINFLLVQYNNHIFGTNKTYPYNPLDVEVVILLQSPGGSVATYGLAAAQLQRLQRSTISNNNNYNDNNSVQNDTRMTTSTDNNTTIGNITDAVANTTSTSTNPTSTIPKHKIKVTVCVDKYAASGGYMIASQADYLIAAPFATIGSVGVILEGFNFYNIATKYGITPLVLKAGISKNPITTWGPITQNQLDSETSRLTKVHVSFQDFVLSGRPQLLQQQSQQSSISSSNTDENNNNDDDSTSTSTSTIDTYNNVCTTILDGSVFLGYEAQSLKLIDDVMTSDEYILSRIVAGDRVLKLYKSSEYNNDNRQRSLRNISPLDILPHLLKHVTNSIQNILFSNNNDNYEDTSRTSATATSTPRLGSNKILILALLLSGSIQPYIIKTMSTLIQQFRNR